MKPAIRVDNLSKQYRIGAQQSREYRTLRDSLTDAFAHPMRRLRRAFASTPGGGNSAKVDHTDFWALQGVSCEIQPGDAVGIIGRNGAGKSTLLKILTRIVEPTHGRAELRGRIASLLEVGTGFHQELTGRENVYLNGAVLGMGSREIARKFDEIVAFAEVDQFLDTPVKRYSSGMYVRLAFAVAAHLQPEILLVDEVLAVGDASFQRKCLGKMGEVGREGRTVVFVSHNMSAVTRLCQRALWLDKGRLRAAGDVEDVVAQYLTDGADNRGEMIFDSDWDRCPGSDTVRLGAVRIRNNQGQISNSLDVRHPFTIELHYRILRPVSSLRLGCRVLTSDGVSVFSSRDLEDGREENVRHPGTYVSRCTIPGNFLNYGQYFVSFGAECSKILGHFSLHQVLSFQIEETGGIGSHFAHKRLGILRTQFPWAIEQVD